MNENHNIDNNKSINPDLFIKINNDVKYKNCNQFQEAMEGIKGLLGKNDNGIIFYLKKYQHMFQDCLQCLGKPYNYDTVWNLYDIIHHFNFYCVPSEWKYEIEYSDKITYCTVWFMLNALYNANIISEWDRGIWILELWNEPYDPNYIVYIKFKEVEWDD